MTKDEFMKRYKGVHGYISCTNSKLRPYGSSSIDMVGARCLDFTVVSLYGRLARKKGHSTSVWECETDDGLHFLITGNGLRKTMKELV